MLDGVEREWASCALRGCELVGGIAPVQEPDYG